MPPAHLPKSPDPRSCFQAALPQGTTREPLVCRHPAAAGTTSLLSRVPLKEALCGASVLIQQRAPDVSDTCLQQPPGYCPSCSTNEGTEQRVLSPWKVAPLSGPSPPHTQHTEATTRTLRVAFHLSILVSSCCAVTPSTAWSKCRGPTLP